MTPIHLLEASGALCLHIAARRPDYSTQRAVLSQGEARCCLHNCYKKSVGEIMRLPLCRAQGYDCRDVQIV